MNINKMILGCVGVVCVTALGVTYFIIVRQDGSVLATLSAAIGGIIGVLVGRKLPEKVTTNE